MLYIYTELTVILLNYRPLSHSNDNVYDPDLNSFSSYASSLAYQTVTLNLLHYSNSCGIKNYILLWGLNLKKENKQWKLSIDSLNCIFFGTSFKK